MGKIKWLGGLLQLGWCLVGVLLTACLVVGALLVFAWCFVDCFVGAAETAAPPMRAAWIWQDAISSYGWRTESDWVADGI